MIKRRINNKRGITMVDVMISVLLLGVVSLTVFTLYDASRVLHFSAYDKVMISYELQYAVDHIYKSVMQSLGDVTSPLTSRPIYIPDAGGEAETLELNIHVNNDNNPGNDILDSQGDLGISQATYGNIVTYTYSKSGTTLMFDDGANPPESMVPGAIITDVTFTLDGELLTISLTGTRGSQAGAYKAQTLTFYSACYPRLASSH
ncbi:hypothetical protein ACFL0P_05350 [Candidatus Omnitrophota bacterium]